MLSALLLAGLFAAPLATLALFVQPPQRGRGLGAWPWARRFVLAITGSLVLAAAAVGGLAAIGATRHNLIAAAIAIVAASLVWLPFTRRWSARAHLCWSATTYLFGAYLVFMIWWTFVSRLGIAGTTGGIILWLLELIAAFLAGAYMWELCDALGREAWTRRVREGVPTAELPAVDALPFVSLHVPAYNEPPDMVIETLTSLLALDYPAYEIIALDDNTTDESLWRPVEAWCHEHGAKFVHLADWPGYKSGALNHALREMIDPRTELIGVIDADYQLEPDFLRRCAPLFADPKVGFIQAPQDYRDWQQAPFYRRLYYSYKYFFVVSQPSRNERDGAIFAGTMGLIRR
ncbi:MAG TPA: glycosyltransferase, partial [Mycobacteriales bacterium]|nr:glycosyltransferase [Mycobacteriales bacterium]